MAESNNLVGIAPAGRIFGSLGREDVRALRLCPAGILARGYEARRSVGIQHGDERRRGAHGGRKFEENDASERNLAAERILAFSRCGWTLSASYRFRQCHDANVRCAAESR